MGSQRKRAGVRSKLRGRPQLKGRSSAERGSGGGNSGGSGGDGGNDGHGSGIERLNGIVEGGREQEREREQQQQQQQQQRSAGATFQPTSATIPATPQATQARSRQAHDVKAAQRMERYLTKLVAAANGSKSNANAKGKGGGRGKVATKRADELPAFLEAAGYGGIGASHGARAELLERTGHTQVRGWLGNLRLPARLLSCDEHKIFTVYLNCFIADSLLAKPRTPLHRPPSSMQQIYSRCL